MKLPKATTLQPDDQPASSATEAGDALSKSLYVLIAQQPFFKGLNSQQLQLLANSALIMEFEPGETIFEEGSSVNRIYIILEGKVLLESELKEHGDTIPIQTFGPGDNLGWSWLFPPHSLHLSARALEPTRALFFYGTRLREHCEQDLELSYQLMKRIAEVETRCFQAAQRCLMEYIGKHPENECASTEITH